MTLASLKPHVVHFGNRSKFHRRVANVKCVSSHSVELCFVNFLVMCRKKFLDPLFAATLTSTSACLSIFALCLGVICFPNLSKKRTVEGNVGLHHLCCCFFHLGGVQTDNDSTLSTSSAFLSWLLSACLEGLFCTGYIKPCTRTPCLVQHGPLTRMRICGLRLNWDLGHRRARPWLTLGADCFLTHLESADKQPHREVLIMTRRKP